MSNSTAQLKKRIAQLNRLIAKFPTVRSLIRKWGFELVVCEGRLETLTAPKVEVKPVQLTIWDIPMTEKKAAKFPLIWTGDMYFIDNNFYGFLLTGRYNAERKRAIGLNIYCAYSQKDLVKDLGAKWDAVDKCWYFVFNSGESAKLIETMNKIINTLGWDEYSAKPFLAIEQGTPNFSNLSSYFEKACI